jgi:uncharacterized hydrophobic protein (TIGR00341 family)
MALRLIEIVVPNGELDNLLKSVEEEGSLGLWMEELSDGQARARVLMPMNQTEALTDRISQEFGNNNNFRMMLFAVEATVPPVDEAPVEPPPEVSTEKKSPQRYSDRVSREELYDDVAGGTRLTKVFLVTVALSAIVAAIGLIRGNVAVVVGAMVIAPLLGPNVALALGTTLGDISLTLRALKMNLVGVGIVYLLSVILGAIFSVDPSGSEILTRTQAGVADVVLALAAGSAGALAYTSGLPASLVGVMVAVALLPPLVTAGLMTGAGHPKLAAGALVLVITNVTCINLSGVLTFLAQRVRPRTWWEERKARRATRRAITLWLSILVVLVAVILIFWE